MQENDKAIAQNAARRAAGVRIPARAAGASGTPTAGVGCGAIIACSGRHSRIWPAANRKQIARQPIAGSSHAIRGKKTTVVPPPSNVIAPTARRAEPGKSHAAATNGIGVNAIGMANPRKIQQIAYPIGPVEIPRPNNAKAIRVDPAINSARAPRRSAQRPYAGPTKAPTTSMIVTPAKAKLTDMPRSRAICAPSIAGRK